MFSNPLRSRRWLRQRSTIVLLLAVLLPLALAAPALAQPNRGADYGEDAYFGPETDYEPQQAGLAKGHRVESSGWQFCAREGELCRVNGWAIVRYGADGRFVYREVRNTRFACDNSRFGDPAPRRGKQCELSFRVGPGYGGPTYGGSGYGDPGYGYDDSGYGDPGYGGGSSWQFCAREGEYCRVDGRALVRYGADGSFTEREVRGGGIQCDNRSFGDPAPRTRKFCEVSFSAPIGRPGHGGGPGYEYGDAETFTACAREGGYCEFRGIRLVRYGSADARPIVREFRGGTACTNAAFGGDPAPGRRKTCEVEDR